MEIDSGNTTYVTPNRRAQYTPRELEAARALVDLHMSSPTSASEQQETASTTKTVETVDENNSEKSKKPNKKIALAQYTAWKASSTTPYSAFEATQTGKTNYAVMLEQKD